MTILFPNHLTLSKSFTKGDLKCVKLLKVWYTLMELGSREEDKIRINISFSYAKVTIELMKKVTLNAYSRTKSTP